MSDGVAEGPDMTAWTPIALEPHRDYAIARRGAAVSFLPVRYTTAADGGTDVRVTPPPGFGAFDYCGLVRTEPHGRVEYRILEDAVQVRGAAPPTRVVRRVDSIAHLPGLVSPVTSVVAP